MRSIGVIVMSFFAAAWWAWGISNTSLPTMPLCVAGVVVSILMAAAAVRTDRGAEKRSEAEARQIGRLVGWASATEGVAILAAVNILNWLGLPDYCICAVAIIVGLHFIPLARIPHARVYNLTAIVLVAIGLVGCLLPWPLRGAVVGTGAALAIWATCVSVIAAPRNAKSGHALRPA